MTICDLKIGDFAYIDTIIGNKNLAKRLLALGCIEGTEVEVKGCAPFGDPLILNIRGFNLALRKKDAKNINITKVKEKNHEDCCVNR
ncbi:ferrous iron transport protein A [Clostridium collagenovorans DSM 3089]|uniref:Ferrous iron transport protein A n=1 Tax=Clostridium collagenovorans DSM 3089 TaxID=1121306 RepID=A0A1M5TKK4_9CLOT|nr:FeoA family protein [Clostridium collagenovorans]SHH51234.1 ferrous iron transport protein A [Clostridium collagenovorans DSM 3089]